MCWVTPKETKIIFPNGEMKTYNNIIETLTNLARSGDREEISKILLHTNYHVNSNLNGTTMLNEAVYACNTASVKWLIEIGADPHALTGGPKYISTYTPSSYLVARNSHCDNKDEIISILESSEFHNKNIIETAGEITYQEIDI